MSKHSADLLADALANRVVNRIVHDITLWAVSYSDALVDAIVEQLLERGIRIEWTEPEQVSPIGNTNGVRPNGHSEPIP